MKYIFPLGKDFKNSECYEKMQKQFNTTQYQFINDWYQRYNNNDYKHLILDRGKNNGDKNIMCFEKFDEAVIQLIKDCLDNLKSVYELDKIPIRLIKYFDENDIDGGMLYLISSQIKDVETATKYKRIKEALSQDIPFKYIHLKDTYLKDYIQNFLDNDRIHIYGKQFLLSFKMIKIVLDNELIKDIDLKEQTTKFYSCYKKFIEIKKAAELNHINKIKAEIKELPESIRQQMIYDGQIKRSKNGLQFDEFLYWTHLLKPGDIFEDGKFKFEIVGVEIYPEKFSKSIIDTNHSAIINIKDINQKLLEYRVFQFYISGESFEKFIMTI